MAVYTRLTSDQLALLATRYRLGAVVRAEEIAEGVENSNYRFVTRQENQPPVTHILTVFEKRVELAALPFYLGVTDRLARAGLPVPRPLRTQEDALFTDIAGKKAAIVTFLPGASARAIASAHCRALGDMMARMHLAAEGFALSRPNDLSLEGWGAMIERLAARADEILSGLSAQLAQEYEFLSCNWPRDLPVGVIHADLFPDNVFFIEEELSGVIDFYFACNDAFMYDAVIALNAWCFERDGSFNLTKARAFLHAYDRQRRLSDAERAALPILARGAALRFLLTRAHDWLHREEGALVTPKDPMEYVRKLRFHQQVKEAGEYGL